MNNNGKKFEQHMNGNLNVNLPKCEINTAHAELCIEEFSYKGITLKGLHAHANAQFTDENIRIEADASMKLFGQLLGTFGDSIIDMMKANTENIRARKTLIDQEIKTEEARTAREVSEKNYYDAKCREVEREAKIKFENLNKAE